MRKIAAVLALGLVACKPSGGGEQPDDEGAKAAAAAAAAEDAELKAVADRIDPGPQAPMFEGMPAWLKGKVDAMLAGTPTGAAAATEARELITAWDKLQLNDPQAMLLGALQLGRGVVLAERAVAAGSADPELLAVLTKAYRLIHQFEVFEKNPMFTTVLSMAHELARKEGGLEVQQIEEGLTVLKGAIARSSALHLHTAARLLREHPRHPTIPDVLLRLAQAELGDERYPEAVALRKLSVARRGARASGPDLAGLADTCYRALDVACGDMSRRSAEERGPEAPVDDKKREAFTKQLAGVDEAAGQARRVIELAQAAGLEPQDERGHLLLKLGRRGEAEALFTRLKAEHPNDARPVTGLAVTALHRDADFVRAAGLLRGARGLTGRDRLYYEVALGTVPMVVISEAMQELARSKDTDKLPSGFDRLVEEVSGLVKEFAAFDPARAAVLELAIGAARDAAPKLIADDKVGGLAIVRAVPAKVFALVQKYPDSKDAWKLLYTVSRLTTDGAAAAQWLTTPLPPALQQDPDVRLQQVRAQLDVAVAFEDMKLLEAAAKSAETLPAGGEADAVTWVKATCDALRGRAGDVEALKRSFDAFAALAGKTTGADRVQALNNAGYLQALVGATDAAATLEGTWRIDGEALAPAVNLGALRFAAEQREGLAELFASAVGSKMGTVQLLARGWLVALADAGFGDVKVTRKEFAEALKSAKDGEFRGAMPPGRLGIAATGDFKMSFGYATNSGLMLIDEVVTKWWLVAVPPGYDAILAGDARAKPPVKPSKGR